MHFEVVITPDALRQVKRLARKYPSLKDDLLELVDRLTTDPRQGTPLGRDLFKVRLAIRSKGKGRSGGARVITCVKVVSATVHLAHVYDKSERSTLSDMELRKLAASFQ